MTTETYGTLTVRLWTNFDNDNDNASSRPRPVTLLRRYGIRRADVGAALVTWKIANKHIAALPSRLLDIEWQAHPDTIDLP